MSFRQQVKEMLGFVAQPTRATRADDSFVINFDDKAVASIILGLVTFTAVYIFLSDQIKNTMKSYMLNNNFGIGITLTFFFSALLYFLICTTLSQKKLGNKYVFSNKHFWLKNVLYFLLFLMHISLGTMLGYIFITN